MSNFRVISGLSTGANKPTDPISCNKVKKRGGLFGSFKQTPNDPIRGVVVGFDPYVNSISMSENRPMISPYSVWIGPGSARKIARGAGFVELFSIGQPSTGSFAPIGPMSGWGCYRKNHKFVDWSCHAPIDWIRIVLRVIWSTRFDRDPWARNPTITARF